ncbi:LysM peptidoglycan-binding domain-containing protein [Dokdonella immobilis]|uniref:Potassium binding protein Kbp n=1 Tax=Dokdonella immobilis TaxID=578942 RepID=A0A1I4XW01_9GAMM|nr:LysM peptidoglycan-binding domain-containing protein [Dokdonella immobilis]SFN29553.1 LysM domain-containing protein [Dokdonella immobilis]
MANDPGKPDFSNVKSGSSSSAEPAKAKPDFGNVSSGVASTAAPAASTLQTYTVAKGDSLSKIAKKFYGNANQWRVIFEANRDRISNPDLIQIGQVLKIPPSKS